MRNFQVRPVFANAMPHGFNGAMGVTLTDGGIETRIIYEFLHQIGNFEAYKLLENDRYIEALASGD